MSFLHEAELNLHHPEIIESPQAVVVKALVSPEGERFGYHLPERIIESGVKTVCVAGPPNIGKSTFIRQLGFCLADGYGQECAYVAHDSIRLDTQNYLLQEGYPYENANSGAWENKEWDIYNQHYVNAVKKAHTNNPEAIVLAELVAAGEIDRGFGALRSLAVVGQDQVGSAGNTMVFYMAPNYRLQEMNANIRPYMLSCDPAEVEASMSRVFNKEFIWPPMLTRKNGGRSPFDPYTRGLILKLLYSYMGQEDAISRIRREIERTVDTEALSLATAASNRLAGKKGKPEFEYTENGYVKYPTNKWLRKHFPDDGFVTRTAFYADLRIQQLVAEGLPAHLGKVAVNSYSKERIITQITLEEAYTAIKFIYDKGIPIADLSEEIRVKMLQEWMEAEGSEYFRSRRNTYGKNPKIAAA